MAYDPIISELLDIYGPLLTEKQKVCLDLYYNKDFSLSEIAQYYNVTRQGIRDFISRGKQCLFDLEDKMNFKSKLDVIKKDMSEILLQTNNLINLNKKNSNNNFKKANEFANKIYSITKKYI